MGKSILIVLLLFLLFIVVPGVVALAVVGAVKAKHRREAQNNDYQR